MLPCFDLQPRLAAYCITSVPIVKNPIADLEMLESLENGIGIMRSLCKISMSGSEARIRSSLDWRAIKFHPENDITT